MFQRKDIIKTETALNKICSKLCDWFVDNKLSVHLVWITPNQFVAANITKTIKHPIQ